ncbi:MAG: hypothetical protein WC604_03790 [Candidatus Gracilibacteria bacterium]
MENLPLNLTRGRLIGAVAALVVVIGAFLPWAKVMGFLSVAGTDGDGMYTMAAGIAGIICCVVKKVPVWVTLILGLVVTGVICYDGYNLLALNDAASGVATEENPFAAMAQVTIGIGAYATALGGLGMIVGAIMDMKKHLK